MHKAFEFRPFKWHIFRNIIYLVSEELERVVYSMQKSKKRRGSYGKKDKN